MAEQTQTQQQPTADEMAKMQQVAQAGAAAAAEAPPGEQEAATKKAMRKEADRVNLELTDEQVDAIASAFATKAIEQLEERGAFDPPPEPVQPPAEPVAPPPPNEAAATIPAESASPPAEAPPAPVKKTWAHRFMGQ